MGNWNITIVGVGSHHNKDNPTDADRIFFECVDKLENAGQSVVHASFTHGGAIVMPLKKATEEQPFLGVYEFP